MSAHVVSVENPSAERLVDTVPCPPEHLPEYVKVVLLGVATTREQVDRLAQSVTALRVRGWAIVAWARWLGGRNAAQLSSDAVLQYYERLGDAVPPSLVNAAVAAHTEEEARALVEQSRQRQTGHAGARYGNAADPFLDTFSSSSDDDDGDVPDLMDAADELVDAPGMKRCAQKCFMQHATMMVLMWQPLTTPRWLHHCRSGQRSARRFLRAPRVR